MKELSLVRRMIYDEMKASGYKANNFLISNRNVVVSKQASSKYKIQQLEKKDSSVETSSQEKRKLKRKKYLSLKGKG